MAESGRRGDQGPVERPLNGGQREPPIKYETMEPQEMIDGLVQVLREVYANDTF